MHNFNIDFLDSIYLQNKLPSLYAESYSEITDALSYNNPGNDFPEIKSNIAITKDVPLYLNLKTKPLPKNIKFLNIEYYKGFAINFEDINNLESYLKSRFGSSSRYKLRRSIKKLENAFDISYKMYFGNITQYEYDFIFEEFFKLLEIRSIEKGIYKNRNIKKKDYYHKILLPLILDKKASLFVIFNSEKPIDVCLNLHADTVVFQLIRTYDISYSKFNTGYIDLMKQIEWCIDNNISMMTFGHSSYYWKKRWCNFNYVYNYHIFYNKKSIKSIIKTGMQMFNLKIRHYLRERGLIDKFHETKSNLKNKLKPLEEPKGTITPIGFNKTIEVGNAIDLDDAQYALLKRTTYEFLFNNYEVEKNIKVFSIANSNNKFLLQGLKNKAEVIIE